MTSGWRQSLALAASRVRADVAFAVTDVVIVVGAYTTGLGFRMLDPLIGDTQRFWTDLAIALPVIVIIHIVANILVGAYGHVWEHASTDEAGQVVLANVVSGSLILLLAFWARDGVGIVVPFLVVVVGAMLALAGMGLVRFRSRLFSFRRSGTDARILVVGTGRDGAVFARQAPTLPNGGTVIGFLSENGETTDEVRRLAGLPILGDLGSIKEIVLERDIDQVVVIGNDAERTREVVDRCLDVNVRLRILPGAADVMLDRTGSLDVRDIHVEDLLVRPKVATDLSDVADLLRDKRVLITGAGGSIGSVITRQVLGFSPGGVWALDRDETLLHDLRLHVPGEVEPVLCDIRDGAKLLRVFAEIRPEVVFHAAALKHVPVLEASPEEAVLTNVVGTRNVIEAGSRAGMKQFVLISTDKAVDPVSVMGATKRVAELMVQAGSERTDGCIYTAVRFGNVLGSRGSVIPTFVEQIKAGGPVTVTDAEMSRYFMTVDEAVQLVLQASALANGSDVFVLDMGEPLRIVDLARRLIRLAGLSPESDVEIRFTGARPGEKLAESLSRDALLPTANDKVLEVRLDTPAAHILLDAVADLEHRAADGDRDQLLALLGVVAEGDLASDHGYKPQLKVAWS